MKSFQYTFIIICQVIRFFTKHTHTLAQAIHIAHDCCSRSNLVKRRLAYYYVAFRTFAAMTSTQHTHTQTLRFCCSTLFSDKIHSHSIFSVCVACTHQYEDKRNLVYVGLEMPMCVYQKRRPKLDKDSHSSTFICLFGFGLLFFTRRVHRHSTTWT